MPLSMIGDLRQHFLTNQSNTRLKTELNVLVEELTSGEHSDLTDHLGTSQAALNGLDRQLELLDAYEKANSQTSQMLATMQLALNHVDEQRSGAAETLLTIHEASSASQVSIASDAARSGFEAAVATLNTRYGDRSLFGGTDIEGVTLASAEIMLADLEVAVSGLVSAADVSSEIDAWFNDTGGGFETVGYQGDPNGFVQRPLSATQIVDVSARADAEAIRDTLKALAKGVFAEDLHIDDGRELQQQAAGELLAAAETMASFQASLGLVENRVEEASIRNVAEQTSFGIARSELVSADPFETASRLEAVQLQLETQYTLTARLSRLSLSEYLR